MVKMGYRDTAETRTGFRDAAEARMGRMGPFGADCSI